MKKSANIIIILAAVLLAGGIALMILGDSSSTKPEKQVERDSKKAVVDNLNTNVEETLRAQRIYKKVFRFGDAAISNMDHHYIVFVNIENIGTKPTAHQHVDLTFLSNTGKVLGTVEVEIPELQPGQKIKIETDSLNEKIYEAFDYKISKAKQAKIQDK